MVETEAEKGDEEAMEEGRAVAGSPAYVPIRKMAVVRTTGQASRGDQGHLLLG